MNRLPIILPLLQCTKCEGQLSQHPDSLSCKSCEAEFPIIDGVIRFVEKEYYKLSKTHSTLEEKTKNYFGYEWEVFENWGFVDDKTLKPSERHMWHGGTSEARRLAFDSKCRLTASELENSNVILDAGCGNGRYTYEAASRTDNTVIGVDIGYGSVASAAKNTKNLDNVIVIQASLFALPFKNGSIDAVFSNGVLMHTGNAQKAFIEIARTVHFGGVFVAHLYHKLNPLWELNDYILRRYTTRLSIERAIVLSRRLASLASYLHHIHPALLTIINGFLRLQPTTHHMFDWYSAPIATHHTYPEVEGWFRKTGFNHIDSRKPRRSAFFRKPWALNVKGTKQAL
ncbi:MAG: class I SAM-dependent methyltransferase [Candidatus Andersenbacteria bacterium]